MTALKKGWNTNKCGTTNANDEHVSCSALLRPPEDRTINVSLFIVEGTKHWQSPLSCPCIAIKDETTK